MISFLKTINDGTKDNVVWIGLLSVFLFVNIFSLSTLTTKPALWYDEGINIELARNFSEFGKLDLMVMPMQFSGQGALIGSTGYTTTVPLAAFFKLFGFGLPQARVYMLLWMNALLFCLFYFARKKWGASVALAILLLTATFAPFYGNGRSVMGEIPGFTFLLLSLFWYQYKDNFLVTGIFLGFAVISKPSVYLFLVPAFIILLLIQKKDFFARVFKLGMGAIMPLFIWIGIYADTALSSSTWQSLRAHFSNPYEQSRLTSFVNIKNNLATFFDSPTLIYFLLFVIFIALAARIKKEYYENNKELIVFAASYGVLEFFYFLKGLGYLRYLIGIQLLLFMLLVPAMQALISRFILYPRSRIAIGACVGMLVLFQTTHLFLNARLFYSDSPQKTSQYIENTFKGEPVGVINLPTVASLIPPSQRIQTISTYGLDKVGEHPLSFGEQTLPQAVVFEKKQVFDKLYTEVLKQHYSPDQEIGNILIYRKH